ncbi:phytanoyl-CoA dioxygenase family protein [Nocardioides mesophilus]|uniref:Phytanoyl-CoA dioxygenase family protein n=2 Tax=Nocardioides mesophilus TaxID=433659 RepID=A0A7G9RH56_9ACTN|nr:phytanoyl-CoA dioxygenase family protein [Nocardioides mesophilus]
MTLGKEWVMEYWMSGRDADPQELAAVVRQPTVVSDYPHCSDVQRGILVYDAADVPPASEPRKRRALMAEVGHALLAGPGVVAFTRAYRDHSLVDAVSAVYAAIIHEEQDLGGTSGDHFGAPGVNDRLWNSLEKLALRDAGLFVRYFGNDVIAFTSEAWLGPGYQVTSQVNLVRPGGRAQVPHRDYHLGFVADVELERYPAHVHQFSPMLTLQGAVAHCDMPLESGPTVFVPHSQKYRAGYFAGDDSAVSEVIAEHAVQIPLRKGDILFFNPAVIHGSGDNDSTDVERMANLLQVSSPFGRSTEVVDRTRVVEAVYAALLSSPVSGVPDALVDNAVAAAAEGYPFPTNLDRDPPIDGLAPPSQAELVRAALSAGDPIDVIHIKLAAHAARRKT